MNTIHVGDKAPVTVTLEVESSEFDLSGVTAASIEVRKPSGAEVSWSASFSWSSPTLSIVHDLATPTSEIDEPGLWKVYAVLTLPSGELRSETQILPVKGRFE